ncbi:D-inositol 3-phosphate glycosyltransferase-like [Acropora millepora]|uniref:D-inositol 3-phosphate glycosyltransferase-like n=1 Tax=Acropora millepora TaxID=45264 RepID=UPI001CF48106|nr:D-inositol 3-phosphate glycosyltransferase-like [Acropora millepora]
MLQDTSAQVIEASSPHKEPLYITLLASEWNSLAGGLSTLNRELAIHLAQQSNVRVSLLVPEGACNVRDKREAQTFDINIVEAKQCHGYEPLDWLGIPPEGHRMDVVVGHGVKLGRQVQTIKSFPQFRYCKWVHTVHTAPEDLGKYKDYKNPSSRGEQKHWDEVGLCKCADLVVAVGPKLMKDYFSYLQGCKKGEDIFGLTPGLFDREFEDIVQMAKTENESYFKVLLCGRGDNEDFELKGYDIAVKAFADPRLKGKSYHLVFVGAPDGMQDEVRKRLLNHGIAKEQLTVRKFVQSRSGIKELLCEVDLAIMPSKSEGFGLVALEALSAGLPVLVGSNSGFASAIRDLPLGAFSIVDSDDPTKWAEAIERVCVRHGVCLKEIKMLRECYGKEYVWKTQCKALVERLWGMISDDQGVSISQALAADDSMEQQTVVIPEGTSASELSKFGGTRGKQPATKTTGQDSLFTSKHSEIAMISETCVEPTQSGISYAGKILFFLNVF